jgi:hypothetical protein
MPMKTRDSVTVAENCMRQREFGRALTLLDEQLAKQPEDLRALLDKGLCHLFLASQEAFLDVHGRAKALVSRLKNLPDDLLRRFAEYEALAQRVTASALVVSALAMGAYSAGCSCGQVETRHLYSAGVFINRNVRFTDSSDQSKLGLRNAVRKSVREEMENAREQWKKEHPGQNHHSVFSAIVEKPEEWKKEHPRDSYIEYLLTLWKKEWEDAHPGKSYDEYLSKPLQTEEWKHQHWFANYLKSMKDDEERR